MTLANPRPSLRSAVDAKCKDCVYDSAEPGGWRQQVAACACEVCPLYAVRPQPRSVS